MKSLINRLEEAKTPEQNLTDTKFALLSDIKQSKKKLDAMEKTVKKAKDIETLVKEKPIFDDFVLFVGDMAELLKWKGRKK